jgi:uncharacterized protein
MESPSHIALHKDVAARQAQIAQTCARLGVLRLDLFGSAARGQTPHDLDFLVDLGERPPAEYARAYFALRDRLAELFSCPVDLITPSGLQNPYFRQRVEQEKILFYAA